MSTKYPIRPWRSVFDICSCLIVIAASIFVVVRVSWWLYPIAAIVIGNRMLALGLLAHEGLHGRLHPNLKLNDFIGRFLCAFPVFVSFSKYRKLHLLHHGTVGSEKWDPDRHLYATFPDRPFLYLREQLLRFITLRTFVDFLYYYNEIPDIARRLPNGKLAVLGPRSDLRAFLLFHFSVLTLAAVFGVLVDYFIFIILPVIFITQPYVYFMGALQHGPILKSRPGGVSRSIRGSKLYMWLLLPLDICYHAEHHLDSSVPHYWLEKYSMDLERDGVVLWNCSYREALRDLFTFREGKYER